MSCASPPPSLQMDVWATLDLLHRMAETESLSTASTLHGALSNATTELLALESALYSGTKFFSGELAMDEYVVRAGVVLSNAIAHWFRGIWGHVNTLWCLSSVCLCALSV